MSISYCNGKYITNSQLSSISPCDRGLLLGDGVFETFLIKEGRVVFFEDHWRRLLNSAKLLSISLMTNPSELRLIILKLILMNDLSKGLARLRITLTRGIGKMGVEFANNNKSTLIVSITKYIPSPKNMFKTIISTTRRNEYSFLSNIKSCNYLDNILAREQASQQHADEALMLNTKGYLACASTANIFLTKKDKLYTPPISAGILPGITRKAVFRLCEELKINIEEINISPKELSLFNEIFITNSLIGIKPILSMGDLAFSNQIGFMTNELQKSYLVLLENELCPWRP